MSLIRKYARWLRWPIRLLVIWFVVHTLAILWDGFTDEVPEKAVMVVLGNKVNEDGSLSPRLEARLQKALELYQEGGIREIVLSGGTGKEGWPEGTVMMQWLEQRRVPRAVMRADDFGSTTHQTVMNLASHLPARDQEIIVVSQYYHVSRCKLALKKAGYSNIKGAHADFSWEWRDPWSIFREFAGYYSYMLRSWKSGE